MNSLSLIVCRRGAASTVRRALAARWPSSWPCRPAALTAATSVGWLHQTPFSLSCCAVPSLPLSIGVVLCYSSTHILRENRGASGRREGRAPSKQVIHNREIINLGRAQKWKQILQLYHKERSEYDNINYATTISQLARMRSTQKSDPLFGRFVDDLSGKLEARGFGWMGVQGAANTIHAIAKMGLKNVSARNIVDFVVKENAATVVRRGKPQAVSNTVWACGKLGVRAPELFVAIENGATQLVEGAKVPQEVSNIAWACGTLCVQAPKLFAAIEDRAKWLAENGTPQAVANTAWACGALRVQAPKLFAAVDDQAEWLVKEGEPQNVANTLWAIGQLQYHVPSFVSAVDEKGAWLVQEGNSQDVANSALAFAQLGHEPKAFLVALSDHIDKLVQDENEQHMCNTCYALTILDQNNSDTLHSLWDEALRRRATKFSIENLGQLAQICAYAEAAGVNITAPSLELLALLRNAARTADKRKSQCQQHVSSCLREIGFEYEENVSPFPADSPFAGGNMLSIEIALPKDMVAIECDSECNFLREIGTGKATRVRKGQTTANRRFLQRMGWNVVKIHCWDWEDAKEKGMETLFLESELRRQLNPSRSLLHDVRAALSDFDGKQKLGPVRAFYKMQM